MSGNLNSLNLGGQKGSDKLAVSMNMGGQEGSDQGIWHMAISKRSKEDGELGRSKEVYGQIQAKRGQRENATKSHVWDEVLGKSGHGTEGSSRWAGMRKVLERVHIREYQNEVQA